MLLNDAAETSLGHPVTLDPALEREFEARVVDSSTLAFRVALGVLRRREDAEGHVHTPPEHQPRVHAWPYSTTLAAASRRFSGDHRLPFQPSPSKNACSSSVNLICLSISGRDSNVRLRASRRRHMTISA